MKIKVLIIILLSLVTNLYSYLNDVDLILMRSAGYLCVTASAYLTFDDDSQKVTFSDLDDLSDSSIPSFERWAQFKYDEDIAFSSDIITSGLIGSQILYSFMTKDYKELFYFSEILLMQNSIGQWVKRSSKRYRPYLYEDGEDFSKSLLEDGAHSFYSMHTSLAFTAATYFYRRLRELEQDDLSKTLLLYGSASSVAVLRVLSGKHFPTDVIVGASIGTILTNVYYSQKERNEIQFYLGIYKAGIIINF